MCYHAVTVSPNTFSSPPVMWAIVSLTETESDYQGHIIHATASLRDTRPYELEKFKVSDMPHSQLAFKPCSLWLVFGPKYSIRSFLDKKYVWSNLMSRN